MSNIDKFIEYNYEEVYERYSNMYPEEIHSDWIIDDHYDEVYEFVEEYLQDEVQLHIIKNRVFVLPEYAELYNHLVENETYTGESHDCLTLKALYNSKSYEVTAVRIGDVFVVNSILEDNSELVH